MISAFAGGATLLFLVRSSFGAARITAALAVVAVLFGWAAGQYPYLLEGSVRISDAAGAHATLVAVLVVLGAGSLVLVPALVWLFVLMQRGALGATTTRATSGADVASCATWWWRCRRRRG